MQLYRQNIHPLAKRAGRYGDVFDSSRALLGFLRVLLVFLAVEVGRYQAALRVHVGVRGVVQRRGVERNLALRHVAPRDFLSVQVHDSTATVSQRKLQPDGLCGVFDKKLPTHAKQREVVGVAGAAKGVASKQRVRPWSAWPSHVVKIRLRPPGRRWVRSEIVDFLVTVKRIGGE